jgi:hypothetical protein
MQVSAQNSKNGTGTDVYNFEVPVAVKIPIVCDGQVVNNLIAQVGIIAKTRDHYKFGDFMWEKNTINHIELTSEKDGEVFVQTGAQEKVWQPVMGMDYLHFNVIGNAGSHYKIHLVIDLSTGDITDAHGNCK